MILSILKVIGCVLLIILLIIIFIIVILLCVPICYQFDGTYYEKIDGMVKVGFIPLGFSAKIIYRNETMQYVVRLFGGVIKTNTDKKISWIGRKFFADDGVTESDGSIAEDAREDETIIQEKNDKTDVTLDDTIFTNPEKMQEHGSTKKMSLTERIQRRLRSLKRSVHAFLKQCKKIGEKKDALLKVYHSKRFEIAKTDLKRYIGKLLQIIKPYDLEGNIHFGMDDPATTGEILGGLALILPLYQNYLTICPDFEKACLDGALKGKGRIFLGAVVILGIKILFNKNLIKVTKKVQTIMEA